MTKERRGEIMSRIRGAHTKPEMVVRRLVHGMGYRYRLHVRNLPGRPDLVFPGRRKVVFVHGCFWHRHSCRRGQSVPSTRTAWLDKLESNRRRDRRVRRKLRKLGWAVLVIWECQTGSSRSDLLRRRIVNFLGSR